MDVTAALILLGLGFILCAWILVFRTGRFAQVAYDFFKNPISHYGSGLFSLLVGLAMIYFLVPAGETFYLHALSLMFIVSGLVALLLSTEDYGAILKFKIDTMVNYRYVVAGLLCGLTMVSLYFAFEAYRNSLVR